MRAVKIGGLLVANHEITTKSEFLDDKQTAYIENTISHHLKNERELLDRRKHNHEYAENQFLKFGFTLRFPINKKIVPSALVLNNNGLIKDLNSLKSYLNSHGIQNSVFYGEDAFFIPIHQNLTYADLDYFIYLISIFIHS